MKKKMITVVICAVLASLLTVSAGAETFWDHFEWDSPEQADGFYVVPTVPLPVVGDLDNSGTLEPGDARLALRYAIGLEQELEKQNALYLADRDGDGKATPADARLILRDAVGLTNFRLPDVNDDVYRIRTHGLDYEYDGLGALKALEVNADKVTDFKGEHLPLWRVDSMETLEQWIGAFRQAEHEEELKLSDWELLPEPTDADVLAFLKRYERDFFAENDLFICYKFEASGSYAQAVYVPNLKDGTLTLKISTAYFDGYAATCDIADWLLFIPVSKELTKVENGCHTFDCLSGDQVTLHDNYEILTEASFDNWLRAYSRILTEDTTATILRGTGYTFSLLNGQDGGYIWVYDADEGVTVREHSITLPQPHAGGNPCLQVYAVTGDKPGTYTLRFRLKRSWETNHIAERTVTVTVKQGFAGVLRTPANPCLQISHNYP